MHLLADLQYTAPTGQKWVAPKGRTVDGASIPRAFWTIIGGPFEGKYRDASVLHDVACDERTHPWSDVARMFYTAMLCSGVNVVKAKTMYYAVYNFGPHWPDPASAPKTFGLAPAVHKNAAAFMPAQPSEDEALRINEWIAQNNPSLAEIEKPAAK